MKPRVRTVVSPSLSTPGSSGELTPVPASAAAPLRRWTTAQLSAATASFAPSRLLGEGGYGEVFRADLGDGVSVAVKRMAADTTEGEAGFLAEVSVTGAVRHPNVLPVLGVVRRRRGASGSAQCKHPLPQFSLTPPCARRWTTHASAWCTR